MTQATGITVDGVSYNVGVRYPDMHRSFEIKEGPAKGENIYGDPIRDVLGTGYSYEMTIVAIPGYQSDYDALYQVLSSPVASHVVTLPYGQETLSFDAMIESGNDINYGIEAGINEWSELGVKFTPLHLQRRAT